MRCPRILAAACVVACAAFVAADNPSKPGSLEQELLRAAPQLIKHLQDKGFKNVGVLKFRVGKDGRTSDNVGTLNLAAARRLEVALALHNDDDEQTQIGLIRDASTVAATIPGASHLTVAGRKLLFSKRYPLAWGGEEVEPDAFLYGVIKLDAQLETMTVDLVVFGKDESTRRRVASFTAATDASTLLESGINFLLRGGVDDGTLKLAPEKGQAIPKALKEAVAVAKANPKQALTAVKGKATPVQLKVFYTSVSGPVAPVPLEFKDDRAVIVEPKEGQGVILAVQRDNSKLRYGVVVQVNGENVLFQERVAPIDCTKMILEPGQQPFSIRGYRTEGSLKPFRVKSVAASRQDDINYGPDVGTISVVVFKEAAAEEQPPELPEDVRAVRRGLPEQTVKDAAALKLAIRKSVSAEEEKKRVDLRGRIDAGTDVPAKELRRVAFVPDPIPVQSLTITYYRPQR